MHTVTVLMHFNINWSLTPQSTDGIRFNCICPSCTDTPFIREPGQELSPALSFIVEKQGGLLK